MNLAHILKTNLLQQGRRITLEHNTTGFTVDNVFHVVLNEDESNVVQIGIRIEPLQSTFVRSFLCGDNDQACKVYTPLEVTEVQDWNVIHVDWPDRNTTAEKSIVDPSPDKVFDVPQVKMFPLSDDTRSRAEAAFQKFITSRLGPTPLDVLGMLGRQLNEEQLTALVDFVFSDVDETTLG
jgi:hypothetical protein